MSIDYSDGEATESLILKLLRDATDVSASANIAPDRHDLWAARYHLSPVRANLLRHLDFEGLDAIELGAGMGGVSRHIAERAKSLTVIEGTEARFRALSERLRDLGNWTGSVSNLQDISLGNNYDVVLLIGVLEYSELFITRANPGESPFLATLKIARQLLRPGGVVVVAIENKLGLKYWRGASEDHTSFMFDGICGYPLTKSPRTFSRQEMLGIFRSCGLAHVDEYYPFPDYKMPSCVLSREFMERYPLTAADIATSQPAEVYGYRNISYFPDVLAAKSVAEAGLLPEFANSFLFLGTTDTESDIRQKLLNRDTAGQRAWHYSMDRRIPVETTFIVHDKTTVEKLPLHGAANRMHAQSGGYELTWSAGKKTDLLTGSPLRSVLLNHAYFDNWDLFLAELGQFVDWAISNWSSRTQPETHMDRRAIDVVALNAQVDPDSPPESNARYQVFDLEWELGDDFTRSLFCFRNAFIFRAYREYFSSAPPIHSLSDLYVHLCERAKVAPCLDDDIAAEAHIQHMASGLDIDLAKRVFRTMLTTAFNARGFARTTADSDLGDLRGKLRQNHSVMMSRGHRAVTRLYSIWNNRIKKST